MVIWGIGYPVVNLMWQLLQHKRFTADTENEEVIQMDKNITRWEYKIVNLHEDGNIKTNYLGEILPKISYDAKAEMTEDDWNLLGNAGWEATGNTFTTNGYSNKVLLKRLKSN